VAQALPPELAALLNGSDPHERDEAWASFVRSHTRLLLHVAHSLGGGHDAVLNRYTYVLEHLRDDDLRRLRAYTVQARCSFSTWLVVAARRMCIDYERSRFGRKPKKTTATSENQRSVRRRLVEGLFSSIDPTSLPDPATTNPEKAAYLAECRAALSAAVGDLDPEDRLLLKLRLQDGLTAREIAELMGFETRFHVYRRVNALCANLRRELRSRGIVAPA